MVQTSSLFFHHHRTHNQQSLHQSTITIATVFRLYLTTKHVIKSPYQATNHNLYIYFFISRHCINTITTPRVNPTPTSFSNCASYGLSPTRSSSSTTNSTSFSTTSLPSRKKYLDQLFLLHPWPRTSSSLFITVLHDH